MYLFASAGLNRADSLYDDLLLGDVSSNLWFGDGGIATDCSGLLPSRQQLPQHIMQDPAVLVIKDLLRRVDPYLCVEFNGCSVIPSSVHLDKASLGELGIQKSLEPDNVISLFS